MVEEKKEESSFHKHNKKNNFIEKARKNPWILASIILLILSLFLLIRIFSGSCITGKVISSNKAGSDLINFYKSVGVEGLTLNSVKENSGLYEMNVSYQGNSFLLYMTKDGKNIIESLIPVGLVQQSSSNSNTQKEIPKSDKPSVELYVFTYCPYGLQMEKAMIPVVKLFKDKIDFKIRQIGAMHGDFEKVEAERQLCIEKYYPDKLLDYDLAFAENTSIGSCNGDATCLAPKLKALFSQFGIDSSKIDSCMKSEGESLYNAEVQNSQSKGISGSPTVLINGVNSQLSRNQEAVKEAICSAFNNVPSECSQSLSTTSASAGFGAGTGSSSSASC
ncbi:hypothetical protein GYA25_01070 [Candidatus Woesearchaeota archaeon]|nr:hypothetical protein [Candidatus Woesearchaeota archaeon]